MQFSEFEELMAGQALSSEKNLMAVSFEQTSSEMNEIPVDSNEFQSLSMDFNGFQWVKRGGNA